MTTNFGADVSTFAQTPWGVGLDPYGFEISGPRVVLECVARSWLDADGANLRAMVGAKLSPALLAARQLALITLAQADERVQLADVQLAIVGKVVRVSSTLYLAEGPFSLVLEIGAATTSIVFGA